MNDLLLNILCVICGILVGVSSGIGFWPMFKQPKNIRIQVALSILGFIVIGIIYKIIS